MSASRTRVIARLVVITFLAACLVGTPASSATAAVPSDLFEGTTAEFYFVPDPLPAGQPGDIIRIQLVSQAAGVTTLRVMYHSRDLLDRDRAVTSIISYPDASPSAGGWPVLATANGTSGLSSPCAMSRYGNPASTFGVTGVGVATDYIGLGPVGETQPYLSRVSEAHSVVDAVRAARNIAETGAGTRWVTVGGSQGGHAAIATNELAAAYGPELDLLGAVALAPGAMFDRSYGGIDDIVTRIVGVMMLYGSATEHPDVIPTDYAGPVTAATAATTFPTKCIGDIITAFVPIPADTYWTNDPRTTEPARSIALANDVGNVAADTPLLLVSGTADITVVIDRARDLFDRLCSNGQATEYTEYEGANHDNIGTYARDQVLAWVADRFAGSEATDSCPRTEPPIAPPIEQPTSTTSTTAPTGVHAVAASTQQPSVSPQFTG